MPWWESKRVPLQTEVNLLYFTLIYTKAKPSNCQGSFLLNKYLLGNINYFLSFITAKDETTRNNLQATLKRGFIKTWTNYRIMFELEKNYVCMLIPTTVPGCLICVHPKQDGNKRMAWCHLHLNSCLIMHILCVIIPLSPRRVWTLTPITKLRNPSASQDSVFAKVRNKKLNIYLCAFKVITK